MARRVKMEDIEIMKRAKLYIESLADGIDPLTRITML